MYQYNFKAAEEIFKDFLGHERIHGMTYAFTLNGKVLHQQCQGVAMTSKPVAPATQFRIASMTKSFCARAILQLRNENKLSFSQTVEEVSPAINFHPSVKKLSIFQLMSMRSRLLTDDPWADRHLGITDQEFDSLSEDISCSEELSSFDYSYSNFGYIVLGRIISAITSSPAMECISREVINPLGMRNTVWNPEGDFAAGAVWRDEQWISEPLMTCRSDTTVFGGLWSTAEDLARWLHFLSLPENEELSFGYSMRPGVYLRLYDSPDLQEESATYGFGLVRSQLKSNDYISHSGGLPGYGSHMRFDRRTGLGVVSLANSTYAPMSRFGATILDAVLRSTPKILREPGKQIRELASDLLNLIVRDNEVPFTNVFSYNINQDYPLEKLRADIAQLKTLLGEQVIIDSLHQLRPGFYELGLKGSGKIVKMRFGCSPENQPKIQTIAIPDLEK